MTRTKSTFLALLVGLLSPLAANADIIDVGDSGGFGYFTDTGTGYTWMDVDNFFNMTYTEIEAAIAGTGFEIATLDLIQELHASLDFDDYFSWNAILGDNDRGGTNIVWGFYDIGSASTAGESWMYSNLSNNGGNKQWNYSTISVPGYYSAYTVAKTRSALDRGAWVVNTSVSVPEPGTLALFGIGLLGMGLARRRRAA